MKLHVKSLKDLGVDLETAAKQVQEASSNKEKKKKVKPIEDILK
jgi:hypothetical protein